jgi:hypothetical protein
MGDRDRRDGEADESGRAGGKEMGVKNGVTSYIHANVTINFPDGHVCCDLCPLLETYARKQCRRTGEYLLDTRGIGYECPLQFEEDRDGV